MTVAEFIAQLPSDPAAAIAELDGFILGDNADPRATKEERNAVVTERIRLRRAMERRNG